MYTKKLGSDVSGLSDIICFDMAPVITTTDEHYISSYLEDKQYPTTLTTTAFLEEMMKDIFRRWYGNAFEGIISYYSETKHIEGNKEYYVIRGKIKLKK